MSPELEKARAEFNRLVRLRLIVGLAVPVVVFPAVFAVVYCLLR